MGETDVDFGSSTPDVSKPQFDTSAYFKALRLQDSFYDYGLDEARKAQVVERLKDNQGILMQSLGEDLYRTRTLNMLSNMFGDNDNMPELSTLGYSFIDNNLSTITQAVIATDTYGHKKEVVDYLLRLTESGNSEYKAHAITALNTILEHDLSVTPPPEMSDEERRKYDEYIRRFESIFRNGTDDQIIQAAQTAARAMSEATGPLRRHQDRMTTAMMWSDKQTDPHNLKTQASRELTNLILNGYGVDLKDFIKAWQSYSLNSGLVDMSKRNLEQIIDLEAVSPGITHSLRHETSNLKLLFRYPKEMLLEMYEHRDNTEVPYGFLDASLADHNEAFSSLSMEVLLRSFHSQLQKEGYLLRIFEPATDEEVFDVGDTLNERYGQKSAQFGVIAGHGEVDSIELDWTRPRSGRNTLTQAEVISGSRKMSGFLKNGAPLILISCSTGTPGGIAQELSKEGLVVSGPDRVAAIGGLELSRNPDGSPNLGVWFKQAGTNTFKDGQLAA